MALINKAAPAFEEADVDTAVDMGAALAAKVSGATAGDPAEAAIPTAAPTTAPVVSTSTAMAPPTSMAPIAAPATSVAAAVTKADPFAGLQNSLRVGFGDLKAIMASNGNILLREGAEALGNYVGLEILSFQDQWVCSPGGKQGDKEAKKYLKFSDDGRFVRETGQPLEEALAQAKAAGYDESKISQRLIVVGLLFFPGVDKAGKVRAELQDETVMIDLAPQSAGKLRSYRINTAVKVAKGLLDPAAALRVRLFAELRSGNGNNWTDANMATWTAADDAKVAALPR